MNGLSGDILFIILIAVALITYLLIIYIIFLYKFERITDFFTVNKRGKKFKINQSINYKGRQQIKNLKSTMSGLKIRDKMVLINQFFQNQLYLLLKELTESQCYEIIVKTHLVFILRYARERGLIEYEEIEENNTALTELSERVRVFFANYKLKRAGMPTHENGRPLVELKLFIGKKDFMTAFYCVGNKPCNLKCNKTCTDNIVCNNIVKKGCNRYIWKRFKTYRIRLNADKILLSYL